MFDIFGVNPLTMTSKYYTCPSCHENTPFKSMATDRVELEKDKGETFRVSCDHCHESRTIHVNDVKAKPNTIVTGIGVAAGIGATVALWQLGFVAWISGGLPIIIYAAQRKAADTFNSYKVKRTKDSPA